YAVSDAASFIQINQLRDLKIQNCKFYGPQIDNTVAQAWCVSIAGGRNPEIVNCSFNGTSFAEILLVDCFEALVSGCSFSGTDQTNALGYGVSFSNACRDCLATDNVFFDKRHAYSTNNLGGFGTTGLAVGVVYNCTFTNSKVHRTTWYDIAETSHGDALDTHAASDWITYSNNTVYGSVGTALNMEGANSIVKDNYFALCGIRACAI